MGGMSNLQLLAAIAAALAWIDAAATIGGFAGVGFMILGFGVAGLASLRWGYDSRDGRDWERPSGGGARRSRQLSPALVDAVLARMEAELQAGSPGSARRSRTPDPSDGEP